MNGVLRKKTPFSSAFMDGNLNCVQSSTHILKSEPRSFHSWLCTLSSSKRSLWHTRHSSLDKSFILGWHPFKYHIKVVPSSSTIDWVGNAIHYDKLVRRNLAVVVAGENRHLLNPIELSVRLFHEKGTKLTSQKLRGNRWLGPLSSQTIKLKSLQHCIFWCFEQPKYKPDIFKDNYSKRLLEVEFKHCMS